MTRRSYVFVVAVIATVLWAVTGALAQDAAPDGSHSGTERSQTRGGDGRAADDDDKRSRRVKDPCRAKDRRAKRRRAHLAAVCGGSGGQARADFNGDGVSDLAVGVPFEDVGPVVNAGAVNVIYGSATGLTATGNQFLHQDSEGIADTAEAEDHFGRSLAAGDFDRDGFSDLAVGVSGEDVGTIANAGAVNVFYGSPTGLAAARNQLWTQDSPGILDAAEPGDGFGFSLVWGDFGADGAADLAVGVFLEDVGTRSNAGAVNVIFGSAPVEVEGGLTATGNQVLHQDGIGVLDQAEGSDFFGHALTAGDFDRSGKADLAVGVSEESIGSAALAGAAQVFYSVGSRLSLADNQLWHQDSPGILETADDSERFGLAVVAGDFNGDGTADLAAGSQENVSGIGRAGAVNVIYGTPDTSVPGGLVASGNQLWHQNLAGILDAVEFNDFFGSALAAGDFDADGRRDLAVGVFGEDIGSVSDAGAVNVIYGAPGGLAAADNQFWHQGNVGADAPETEDFFGLALSGWNFGKGAPTDLAVGAPREDFPGAASAGVVHVLYGVGDSPATPTSGSIPGGLRAAGSQLWHQDSPGILDSVEPGADQFGVAVY
jgi:hypothetical protein